MQSRAANLVTERLSGWSPSPEAQQIVIWRVVQMFLARYGSGQFVYLQSESTEV